MSEQRQIIAAWSPSRAKTYKTCPLQGKLAYVDRIKELPRAARIDAEGNPLEHANDRGSRIHDAAENYVRAYPNRDKLIPELSHFKSELTKARDIFTADPSRIEMEQMWAFDRNWNTVDPKAYKSIWYRLKVDLNISVSPTHKLIIDYKSGRRKYNEITHNDQMLQYALGSIMRYPTLTQITVELWYTDENLIIQSILSADKIRSLFPRFNNLGLQITTDVQFKPKPSHSACRFCPFRSGANKWVVGTGDCVLNPEDKTEKTSQEWRRLKNEAMLRAKE